MIKNNKKWIFVFPLLLVLFTFSPKAYANNRDVLDNGNVINAKTEEKILDLNRYGMKKIKTRPQIAVMTTSTDQPTRKVGVATFKRYKIGRKGYNNGVLLVINTYQHNYAVIPGTGVAKILNSEFRHNLMTPKVKHYLIEENYSAASWLMVNHIYNELGTNQNMITVPAANKNYHKLKRHSVMDRRQKRADIICIILLILGVGFVAFFIFRDHQKKKKELEKREAIIKKMEERAINTKKYFTKESKTAEHDEIVRDVATLISKSGSPIHLENATNHQTFRPPYSQMFGNNRSHNVEEAVEKNIFQRHPYMTGFGGGLLASHLFNRLANDNWYWNPFGITYPWWLYPDTTLHHDTYINNYYDGDDFDHYGGTANDDLDYDDLDDDSDNSWDNDYDSYDYGGFDSSSDNLSADENSNDYQINNDYSSSNDYDGSWSDDNNYSDSSSDWDSNDSWSSNDYSSNSWNDNSWGSSSNDSWNDSSWDSSSGWDSGSDDGSW